MSSKKTLVIGASENPSRYSFLVVNKLRKNQHEVVAIGKRTGFVNDVNIQTGMPELNDINTVTLYLNPINQKPYYDYILSLKPQRIIFNPGTENPELEGLAKKNGINTIEACTLVMLSTNQF